MDACDGILSRNRANEDDGRTFPGLKLSRAGAQFDVDEKNGSGERSASSMSDERDVRAYYALP